MSGKMSRTVSAAICWIVAIIGAVILAFGIMGLTCGLKDLFADLGMKALGKTLDKWPIWQHFLVAAVGFVLITMVVNTLNTKGQDPASHSSRLLRRPIQRCYPIFLLPTLGAFCIGFLYPFLKGMFLSFCKF